MGSSLKFIVASYIHYVLATADPPSLRSGGQAGDFPASLPSISIHPYIRRTCLSLPE